MLLDNLVKNVSQLNRFCSSYKLYAVAAIGCREVLSVAHVNCWILQGLSRDDIEAKLAELYSAELILMDNYPSNVTEVFELYEMVCISASLIFVLLKLENLRIIVMLGK